MISKLAQRGSPPPPEDSPRRGYPVCDGATLLVRYDAGWKVMHASYSPPRGATHGLPLGKSPEWREENARETLRNQTLRLEQMRRVEEVCPHE